MHCDEWQHTVASTQHDYGGDATAESFAYDDGGYATAESAAYDDGGYATAESPWHYAESAPHDPWYDTAAPARRYRKYKGSKFHPREYYTRKFVKNQRRSLNYEIYKWKRTCSDNIRQGRFETLKASRKQLDHATEKMHQMNDRGRILLDTGDHFYMNEDQILYNQLLIEEEESKPTLAEHKEIKENGWMKAPEHGDMHSSAWIKQMCIRMKAKCLERIEAETTAACEAFQQQFLAENGYKEWAQSFEPPSQNPILCAGPRSNSPYAGWVKGNS